ncbi:unnamed protein product [Discosporangium mesarthrocarpum]
MRFSILLATFSVADGLGLVLLSVTLASVSRTTVSSMTLHNIATAGSFTRPVPGWGFLPGRRPRQAVFCSEALVTSHASEGLPLSPLYPVEDTNNVTPRSDCLVKRKEHRGEARRSLNQAGQGRPRRRPHAFRKFDSSCCETTLKEEDETSLFFSQESQPLSDQESGVYPANLELREESEPCDEDEKFMLLALRYARRAFNQGEVPVGAVLVGKGVDGKSKVISGGCNSVERLMDISAHAEMLCLKAGARVQGNWRLLGTTLYVTVEPCVMCLSAAQVGGQAQ